MLPFDSRRRVADDFNRPAVAEPLHHFRNFRIMYLLMGYTWMTAARNNNDPYKAHVHDVFNSPRACGDCPSVQVAIFLKRKTTLHENKLLTHTTSSNSRQPHQVLLVERISRVALEEHLNQRIKAGPGSC